MVLFEANRAEDVEDVREALDEAKIPYETGLSVGTPPGVVFTVPRERLREAREIVAEYQGVIPSGPVRFPWQQFRSVSWVIGLHFLLVIWMLASGSGGIRFLRQCALQKGMTLAQPWRLLTSLFMHVDLAHVFWNGASMMVFAVPLLIDLRLVRTALVYLAAGVGGAVTALAFANTGTTIVGSSGAVAGLFGAWLMLALRRARRTRLSWRAHVRTLGIAFLVLPSLLSPMTTTGQSVSVSSHIGGLATGMLIGVLLSSGMLLQSERREETAVLRYHS